MLDLNEKELPLQPESPANAQPEVIFAPGAREVAVQSCIAAAAIHCLIFTERISISEGAAAVKRLIQEIMNKGVNLYTDFPEASSGKFSLQDVALFLASEDSWSIPIVRPVETPEKPWKRYVHDWLKEGGAMFGPDLHANSFWMRPDDQIWFHDPWTGNSGELQLNEVPDNRGQMLFLIPPKPENCTTTMQQFIDEQIRHITDLDAEPPRALPAGVSFKGDYDIFLHFSLERLRVYKGNEPESRTVEGAQPDLGNLPRVAIADYDHNKIVDGNEIIIVTAGDTPDAIKITPDMLDPIERIEIR